jgi:hypothetical protein
VARALALLKESPAMQFGMYLVENGVITCEEFFEALKLQLKSRPQLGALAIEKRKLNVRQVFGVLRSQCDSPDDMFGELAVKLGYLTADDLAQLLHEQSVRVRPFSEILIEADILPAATVERHYREYRSALEPAEQVELPAMA